MQIRQKDNKGFLSTHDTCDFIGLLENLPKNPIPTCMIFVEPRHSKTGFNEEIDSWCLNFWKNVLETFPLTQGHRVFWGRMVFFSLNTSLNEMRANFIELLKNSIHPNLQSKTLFSTVQNNSKKN